MDMIKMVFTNINAMNVLKGYPNDLVYTEPVFENVNLKLRNYSWISPKVAAHKTAVYINLGVEKALQHTGKSKLAHFHVVRTIFLNTKTL